MNFKEYTIRRCRKEEYRKLVDFFRLYWNPDHVFCRNRKIFEFQHGTAAGGEYDFIVAVHNESQEFHAVLGYISSSTYDGGSIEKPDAICGALWKVRDDVHNRESGKLGLGVLFYLMKRYPDSDYITLGLSHFSRQIYDSLHFDFGKMNHCYLASDCCDNFVICENPVIVRNAPFNRSFSIREIEHIPDDWKSGCHPAKTAAYFENRYLNHPFYHYELLAIYREEEIAAIWVIRETDTGESRCLRIVDMTGDFDAEMPIAGNIQQLLKSRGAEYIDCYNHGIDSQYFRHMGFEEVGGDTVIPNYFEPFEKRNVDIHYASCAKHPVVIFKGDADQDRPSLLEPDMGGAGDEM